MARDLKFDEDGIDEHVIVKRKKGNIFNKS